MEKINIHNVTISFLMGIIICLVLCIIFKCERKPQLKEIIKSDTVYIPTIKHDTIDKVIPIKTIDTVFTKAQIIYITDSVNCIQMAHQLYSKNVYSRLLINEPKLIVKLIDTVSNNQLNMGTIEYKIIETVITNTVKPQLKTKFNVGVMTNFNNANIYLNVITPNKLGYLLGFDVINKKPAVGFNYTF